MTLLLGRSGFGEAPDQGDRLRVPQDLGRCTHGPSAILRGCIRAVLFDVDFTLARPGPELGPEGYRQCRRAARAGARPRAIRGCAAGCARLVAAASRAGARRRALDRRSRRQIVRGMGGDAEGARACAEELVRAWELHERFTLYDDALPALAALREHEREDRAGVERQSRSGGVRRPITLSTWTARSVRARSAARSRIPRSSGVHSRCSTWSRRKRR